MYSLGCVVYAVHCKGTTPHKTHGSLSGLRDSAGSSRSISGLERLDPDLQGAVLQFSFIYVSPISVNSVARIPFNPPTTATVPFNAPIALFLLLPPDLYPQFPGSIQLRNEIARREGIVHERAHQRAQQVLGRFKSAEDTSLSRRRGNERLSTASSWILFRPLDERHPLTSLYPPECVRHLNRSHADAVRHCSFAELEATFCCQGAAAKHAHALGQSAFTSG
jgi:hypothetical protein